MLDLPLIDECPPQFICQLGKCTCSPGFCDSDGMCLPRSCTAGARPPAYVPSEWVERFARLGPPCPPPDSSYSAWKVYGWIALGWPALLVSSSALAALGVAYALAQGPELWICRRVPNVPVFLTLWGMLTVAVVGSSFQRNQDAADRTFAQSGEELRRLSADSEKVLELAHELLALWEDFDAAVNRIPASCAFGAGRMTSAVEAVHRATQCVADDIAKLDAIFSVMPGRLNTILFRESVASFFIVYLPVLPNLLLIAATVAAVVGTFSAYYTPHLDLASRASAILRRRGALGVAALMVFEALEAAICLHAGIVAGQFCRHVDENVLGIVASINYTAFGEGRAHITNEVIGAARFYVAGDGTNPLQDIIAQLQGNLDTLVHIREDTFLWMEKVAGIVCPQLRQVNAEEVATRAQTVINDLQELLLARNMWPHYDKVAHKVACDEMPRHLEGMVRWAAFISFVLVPVLAIAADVDLKRMVVYKSGLLEDDGSADSDGAAEEVDARGGWRKDPEGLAMYSSATYVQAVDASARAAAVVQAKVPRRGEFLA